MSKTEIDNRVAANMDLLAADRSLGQANGIRREFCREAAATLRRLDAENKALHLAAAAPQAQSGAPDWWRKRADEIEVQVAATGSSDAMRCYTDMRTLLQSAAAPQAPAAPSADNGDKARMEWLEVRKYRDVRDGGYSASYSIHLPAMAVGPWQKKNGGEFDHQTLREAIDAARAAAKIGGAA